MSKQQTSSGDRTSSVPEQLSAQRAYTEQLEQRGFDFSLVVADAFVRGIRDVGYRHTGTAIDELIDNAIQASAENVHVVFGFGEGSDRKPDRVAVIDDGHGMDPAMIRAAAVWGGTHRENDRTGFGRYGYGLPSASVSQGRRFTVYSIPTGGTLHKVAFDVDELGEGGYRNGKGRIVVPEPTVADLPEWVADYLSEQVGVSSLEHGTVVVIEKTDRFSWATISGLEKNLFPHFGVTYRNFLRQVNVFLQGKPVEAVDPLFTTPGMRYFDLDEDRAQALEPLTIEVKERGSEKPGGLIKVRFSLMPPSFGRKDKTGGATARNQNPRFSLMKDHNGLIIMRAGRQIDVVSRNPWTSFVNYDRNWGIEIDFPPTLDEEFSITTSKQQVVLSDRIWEILRENGVEKAIRQLRTTFREMLKKAEVEADQPDGPRPSERAMEEAAEFKTRKPAVSLERQKKIDEVFRKHVLERAKVRGIAEVDAETELVTEILGRPYRVEQESHPGAPFFRVEQVGGQKVLYLNTGHRFYTDVYAGSDSTPRLRWALEVLLFVIGDCELDSSDNRRLFYENERNEWSRQLNIALQRLEASSNSADAESFADEVAEAISEAAEAVSA